MRKALVNAFVQVLFSTRKSLSKGVALTVSVAILSMFSPLAMLPTTFADVGTCVLSSVSSPTTGEYVTGNNYQITLTTTDGASGNCADGAASFKAQYIYDAANDGFLNDSWVDITSISPGGEQASYSIPWDTTTRVDSANTRYKVRVLCNGGTCSGGPLYVGGSSSNTIGVNNSAPTVTDAHIATTIHTDNGVSSVAGVGDVIRVTWDNSSSGDNNKDIVPGVSSTAITANLSAFGGSATQTLYDDGTNGDQTSGDNVYTYDYTVTSGAIDTTSLNATVSVADAGGRSTGPVSDTSNMSVDSQLPTISAHGAVTNTTTDGYVDITFSEGVYGNITATNPLNSGSLAISLTSNGGNASAASITSVTQGGGALALVGGETSVRVNFSITGTPSGSETVTITPTNGSTVYDNAGNAMDASQTTGTIALSDKLPASLSASNIVINNTVSPNTVTLTFSEALEATAAANTANYSVTNNAAGITYSLASAALSAGNTVVTLSLAALNTGNTATFITNTDLSGHIKVTPSASVTDVALNAYTGGVITESGATHNSDITAPAAAITYSINHAVKSGDSQVITATFNEPLADAPVVKIAISGSNTVAATDMTKVDSTHYTYTHTVAVGDGTATVALSIGTDPAGNVVTSAPISGADFTVDNTQPTAPTITSPTLLKGGSSYNIIWTPSTDTNFSSTPVKIEYSAAGDFSDTVTVVASTENDGSYTWTVPSVDLTTAKLRITATDTATNTQTSTSSAFTIDNTAPIVTAGNITVTGNNGTAGVFKKGDTVTATWDNTGSGDNNPDIASVTMDFSEFGGGATVTAVNTADSWAASYVLANDITLTAKKVSVTATDDAENTTTTADNTTYDVDTVAPAVAAVTIESDNTNPLYAKSGDTVTFSITYSKAVTAVANTPTTANNIAGGVTSDVAALSSTSDTIVFTVAGGDNGAVTANNVDFTITDASGNAVTITSLAITSGSVTADTTAPVKSGAPTATAGPVISDAEKTAGVVIAVSLSGTNAVAGDDVEVLLGGVSFGTPVTHTLTSQNITDGTVDITIPTGAGWDVDGPQVLTTKITDLAGNVSAESDPLNVTLDTAAPADFTTGTVITTGGTVVAGKWNSTNTGVNVTVPVANDSTLTNGTIQLQAKVGSGSYENLGDHSTILVGNLGGTQTVSVTDTQLEALTGFAEDEVVTITAIITDIAENSTTGTESVTTLTIDQTGPTVAVTYSSSPNPAKAGVVTVTATFGEVITGTPTIAINQQGTTDIAATPMTGAGAVWTYDYTVVADNNLEYDDGVATVTIAAATDAAGNANQAATGNTFTTDTIAPTVTITDDEAGTANIAGGDVTYTFEFSEAVTGFDDTDVTVVGGTKGAFTAVDGNTYTLVVTPDVSSTTNITVDVAGSVAVDAAGNNNSAATQSVQAVDTVAPTIAVTSDDMNLKAGETATITFELSEDSVNFEESDVVVAGGALSGFAATDGNTYTATFTPTASSTANGTVNVAGATFTDAAGNDNTAATELLMAVDTAVPTVTITDDEAGTANIAGGDVTYTFEFSEAVTGFDDTDVTVAEGTKGAFTAVDGNTYTLVVTPDVSSTANITVDVAGSVAIDAAGNNNSAATQSVQAVDTVVPTVGIVVTDTALAAGETSLVTFTFNEAVTGFTNADLTIANGTLTAVSSGDGGTTWTATLTPTASIEDATNVITIDKTGVADAAGNPGVSTTDSNNYAIDTTAPTVTITDDEVGVANIVGGDVTYTFEFTETVTGFDDTDVTVAGGTKGVFTAVDGNTYTLVVTPNASSTTNITVDVAGSVAVDAAGNNNSAATQSVQTVDTVAPSVLSVAVASNNATTTLAKNANTVTFTLTYNEAVTATVNTATTANNIATAVTTDASASASASDAIIFTVASGDTGAVSIATANITLTDANGNTTTIDEIDLGITSGSVTADTTAPAQPIINSVASLTPSPVSMNDATPTLVIGNLTSGDTVKVYAAATEVASGTATGATLELTTSELSEATHSLTAVAIDPAGNASSASTAFSYTYDGTLPAVVDNWSLNMNIGTVVINFSESMDITQNIDETKITLQKTNNTSTAGNYYTLTTSTSAWTDSNTLTITLSAADLNGIKNTSGLAVAASSSFLEIIAESLLKDNATNALSLTNVTDGACLQSATFTADTTAPTVTKLGNNSADVTIAATATETLTFSEALSSAAKTNVQNALTAGANKTITYSWNAANTVLTITGHATDTTTFADDVTANIADIAGNTVSNILLVDSELAETQVVASGATSVSSTQTEAVVADSTTSSTITVPSNVTNATLNVASITTVSGSDKTALLPAITVNATTSLSATPVSVAIPTGTTVTADSAWDGKISVPTVQATSSVTAPTDSGFTNSVNSVILLGSNAVTLTFDKAVRILVPGQAGKKAGYVPAGSSTMTEITNTCAADDQTTGDALAAGAECKIDVGSDLVIWTKHFTQFASYTQTAVTTSSGGGGGGGSVDTTTPFKLSSLESDVTSSLTRPIDLSNTAGVLTRSIELKDYNSGHILLLEKGTKVTYDNGEAFSGVILTPSNVLKGNQPKAPEGFQVVRMVSFGDKKGSTLQLSQKALVTIKTSFLEKVDPANVQVYYYNEETSKYEAIGGVLSEDQKSITVDVNHFSTYAVLYAETKAASTATEVSTQETSQETETTTTSEGVSYKDIQGHWGETYIRELQEKGVFKSQEEFRPNDELIRAEMVKIVVEALDLPMVESDVKFVDVDENAWYVPYMRAAYAAGVIKGYDNGTFLPAKPVTRAEALKMILVAAGVKDFTGTESFDDVQDVDWFSSFVKYGVSKSIVKGRTEKQFAPGGTVTRAEIAKMVSLSLGLNK